VAETASLVVRHAPRALPVLVCPRCEFPLNQHFTFLPAFRGIGPRLSAFAACVRCGHTQFLGPLDALEVNLVQEENHD
jgi:hypothetical protein